MSKQLPPVSKALFVALNRVRLGVCSHTNERETEENLTIEAVAVDAVADVSPITTGVDAVAMCAAADVSSLTEAVVAPVDSAVSVAPPTTAIDVVSVEAMVVSKVGSVVLQRQSAYPQRPVSKACVVARSLARRAANELSYRKHKEAKRMIAADALDASEVVTPMTTCVDAVVVGDAADVRPQLTEKDLVSVDQMAVRAVGSVIRPRPPSYPPPGRPEHSLCEVKTMLGIQAGCPYCLCSNGAV